MITDFLTYNDQLLHFDQIEICIGTHQDSKKGTRISIHDMNGRVAHKRMPNDAMGDFANFELSVSLSADDALKVIRLIALAAGYDPKFVKINSQPGFSESITYRFEKR